VINNSEDGNIVTFENSENSSCVIYGFTISNIRTYSRGIMCLNSSPKILSNIISNNNGGQSGLGIYLENSSSEVSYNRIINNTQLSGSNYVLGAGLGVFNSNVEISYNIIDNNTVNGAQPPVDPNIGCGIGVLESTVLICNNYIKNNHMSGSNIFGGGIYIDESDFLISDNIIIHNSSNVGGGLYIHDSNGNIINNFICNNEGSGIVNLGSPRILNNIICNNRSSDMGGGGIIDTSSSHYAEIINNIICNNYAFNYGGGGLRITTDSILYNNIIYGNEAYSGAQIMLNNCSAEIYYCDIEGGFNAISSNNFTGSFENNIDQDPEFFSPTLSAGLDYDAFSANWFPSYSSPCIDAGIPDTSGLNLPEYDFSGSPRIYNELIDMGCYEWQGVGSKEFEIPIFNKTRISNYPNPFNPITTIEFSIQNTSEIELSIYNIKGQKMKILANNKFSVGSHSLIWNGDNDLGKSVSSGIYYYNLKVNGKTEAVKKCLLLK